uniref:Uncharacterized protein n=1 Tax=Rhipicephalus zambeziensis TaxID=60191 RepID=A0A224YF11_9ACAR
MHSSSDRCRSQRVPRACCYSWYVQARRKKEKKRQGSKKRNGRKISSRAATGRSSPPRKIMLVFTSLSVFPVSVARGKKKKKLKGHPEEGKTIYSPVVYSFSCLQTPRPASRALSVHFGGKTCFINAYTRAVICPCSGSGSRVSPG